MDSSPLERPAPPAGRPVLVVALLATAGVVLAVDQLAKAWAVRTLGDGRSIEVVGELVQLRLFRNPGAAFSFATGTTWIFTVIATVASIAIVRASRHLGSSLWALTLGLLLGGALGNLTDRLFREPGFPQGHVVDFIDLPRLFVFNVADASITSAAALIALLSWWGVRVDGGRGTHPEPAEVSRGGQGDIPSATREKLPGGAREEVPGGAREEVPGDARGEVPEEVRGEVRGQVPGRTPGDGS
jgi:signal peptidase II